MKNKYFPALTGIRAIAALMVVLHHLLEGKFESNYINALFRELNIGVNIFFVLSGFLIWHRYADNLGINRIWFKKYIINRIARIYPLYFFWTTIVMMLGFIAHNETWHQFIYTYFLNITFLKGFTSEYVYTGIAQGWTLSVEELFYLSAPFLFILNLRKKIPLSILGVGIASIGYGVFLVFKDLHLDGFFDSLAHIKITTYFGRFTEFFAGIYLAKIVNSDNKPKSKYPTFTFTGLTALSISILIILPLLQTSELPFSIQTNSGYLFNILILPIFIALLFYGLITEVTLISRILSTRSFIILGKSSYALYLVHWGMTSYLIHRFVSDNIVITLILTYLLSIILWKYCEEPANNFIRKRFNTR